MRRIEATIDIGADRQLVLQLPEDVAPGEHRVIVLVDDQREQRDKCEAAGESGAESLEWEGNILVFTGELKGDPIDTLRELREERERRFLFGPWE